MSMTLDDKAEILFQLLPKGLARSRTSKKRIRDVLGGKDVPPFPVLKKAVTDYIDFCLREARKKGGLEPNVKGLHLWIRDGRYDAYVSDAEEEQAQEKHNLLERANRPTWRTAGIPKKIEELFEQLSACGITDDILNKFVGRIGYTNVNADRDIPPTVVIPNSLSDTWFSELSRFAEKLGWNHVYYTKEYVAHVKEKKRKKQETEEPVSGKITEASGGTDARPEEAPF